jgi:hypothetical protein
MDLAAPLAAGGSYSLEAFLGMSDSAVRSVLQALPGFGELQSAAQRQ